MGLMDKRRALLEERATQQDEPEYEPTQKWGYKALNLGRVMGPMMQGQLNELGAEGYEAVCVVEGYLILKRPV